MIKYSVLLILLVLAFSCGDSNESRFDQLNKSAEWNLDMYDYCTDNWQTQWFLDGKKAKVEYSDMGMNFCAGPKNSDDAHHAVLWTRQSFKGDVKIEYTYTRTDSQCINVNNLYIQALGTGDGFFDKDIFQWNKYREVPAMRKYYFNMNTLHVSYAAFPRVNQDPENDYVRLRKYPVKQGEFEKSEILPLFSGTGLFLPGETYKITVIKTATELFFNVKGKETEKLFYWKLTKNQSPEEGRIGLRHMYTRSANYKDFKVYTR